MNPILEALKQGECFRFPLLVSHYEDCAAYWEWWWSQTPLDQLTRPCLIDSEDPILASSSSSLFIDTLTYYNLFDKFLLNALKADSLPQGEQITRTVYQEKLIDSMVGRSVRQQDRKIIFAGGGYGAGKTTVLSVLAKCSGLSLRGPSIVGADYFKPYLPEYEAIRRIGDGRASSTVQAESRILADQLFDRLVKAGRSFIWDSSMSNLPETKAKIELARSLGYELEMVAVASPVDAAIRKAMHRAKATRRFAHPDHLPSSHHLFARAFPEYVACFQKVMLFWNDWAPPAPERDPLLIARKDATIELECFDEDRLNRFLAIGNES